MPETLGSCSCFLLFFIAGVFFLLSRRFVQMSLVWFLAWRINENVVKMGVCIWLQTSMLLREECRMAVTYDNKLVEECVSTGRRVYFGCATQISEVWNPRNLERQLHPFVPKPATGGGSCMLAEPIVRLAFFHPCAERGRATNKRHLIGLKSA